MTRVKTRVAGPTAALAGIPAGLQAQGVWAGRRQLFVRFAGEAETATMYTADALANEIERAMARSKFHSVAIGGRDPLGNVEYLRAAFEAKTVPVPVMLDCDGQRPGRVRRPGEDRQADRGDGGGHGALGRGPDEQRRRIHQGSGRNQMPAFTCSDRR
jgi:hypothetical protein